MRLPDNLADMIAAAKAEGRFRVVAEGERSLPAPLPRPADVRIRPECCGAGRMLSRLPGIDAYDRGTAR